MNSAMTWCVGIALKVFFKSCSIAYSKLNHVFLFLGFHTVAIRAVDSLEEEAGNKPFGASWVPYTKALVYFNAGEETKKEETIRQINLAIKNNPKDSMAYYKKGEILRDWFSKYDEAIEQFEAAIEISENENCGMAQFEIVKCLELRKKDNYIRKCASGYRELIKKARFRCSCHFECFVWDLYTVDLVLRRNIDEELKVTKS